MKKISKQTKGIAKGAPSGLVISLLVHAAAFLLAGLLVVFSVVKKKEVSFVPPPAVERPKMKLKKPKVKVKKTAKPASPTRIMAKVNKAVMPDLALPELGGAGSGLGGIGDLGGFGMMPDLDLITTFGVGQSIGNDFVGTFYDMKRGRSGNNIPNAGLDGFVNILHSFMKKGFDTKQLSRYYRSPKKLYTTIFAMPPDLSLMAPQAFGEYDTVGYQWMVHYKGDLVYPEDITFRFWGAGDDVLAVRVDGEFVLVAVTWFRDGVEILKDFWHDTSADSLKYALGNGSSVVGDWITLKAGEPLDMEVMMAEIPGGNFQAILCVEVQGVDYPRNPFRNGPTLPVFKTEPPSLDLMEKIHAGLYEGDATTTNGPVFRDYGYESKAGTRNDLPKEEPVEPDPQLIAEERLRIWNRDGSNPFQAEFVMLFGDKVVLKNRRGKKIKIPVMDLSAEDRNYVTLESPPKFKIDFSKKSAQVIPPEQPPDTTYRPIQLWDYEFGVKLKQTSAGKYHHDLQVEYFAVGDEVDGDNFVLLERNTATVKPADFEDRAYEFYGDKVRLKQQAIVPTASMRGTKYGGYLITVTDVRGKIIQHAESNQFLFKNMENLKQLAVGRHFDKRCRHVGPARPQKSDRPPDESYLWGGGE
jgi:hypothetical protein